MSSFEAVYEDRWAPMVKLAGLTTGSRALAEEIVQDAFIQLHRNWGTIQNPSAWLRVAVVNGGKGWLRRQALERRQVPGPSNYVELEDGVAMREALRHLTRRQRAAVVLRYYEDLPELEIAEVLGCRPGTVKSLLDRAKDKLKKELQR